MRATSKAKKEPEKSPLIAQKLIKQMPGEERQNRCELGEQWKTQVERLGSVKDDGVLGHLC